MSNDHMADYAEDSVVVYSGLNPTARAFQSYMEVVLDATGLYVNDQPEGAVAGANTGFRTVSTTLKFDGTTKSFTTPFGMVQARTGEVARVYYDFEEVSAQGTASATLSEVETADAIATGAVANAIKEGNFTLIQKGKWASGTIGSGTAPTGTIKAQMPSENLTAQTGGAGHLDIGVTQNLAAAEDFQLGFQYGTAPSAAAAAVPGAIVVRLSYVGLSTAVV